MKSPDSELPSLLNLDFYRLSAAHFLQGLGYASLILLPVYLDHLGASRTLIGTIIGVGSAAGLLARPFIAWFLDSIGRKAAIYTGTVLLGIGMVGIYGVVDLGPWVYIDQSIIGVAEGFLFTGYFTFASDIIPASRRTEGLALFGISGLAAMLVNPFSQSLEISAPDLRYFLPLVGLAAVTSALFIWPVPENAPKKNPGDDAGEEKNQRSMRTKVLGVLHSLSQPKLIPCWLASILFAGVVSIFLTFATVAAASRGLPDARDIWLAYTAGAISLRAGGGRFFDSLGPRNLIVPGAAAYIIALWLLAGATSHTDLVIVGLLAGLGHGVGFPVITSMIISRSPILLRGTALATFTALWEVAAISTRPVAGALSDWAGDAAMFELVGVVSVMGISLWAVLEHWLAREDGFALRA